MPKNVLVTGGGGFLGTTLANLLLQHGYNVKVLDIMNEQVHGSGNNRPAFLDHSIEFIRGDLRHHPTVEYALQNTDIVVHLAALEGIGQSMYRLHEYIDHNCLGTAVLLENILKKPIEKLIVASSLSVYGEGLYIDRDGNPFHLAERKIADLKSGNWNPYDEYGDELIPVATPEYKAINPLSHYAQTKYHQERMCLITGQAYHIPTAILRFSNIYGPKQPFNPYSGVLGIISARILNNNPPLLFEDGFQLRDFIHVHDAAEACMLTIESDLSENLVVNIGSGKSYTIREVALKLSMIMERHKVQPEVTRKYRVGDIRHCFADISKARQVLGFSPKMDLDTGLLELGDWLKGQQVQDRVAEASLELSSRGLTV